MTACLAAERCDSPTLITKYALARNYSTNDPFITMHGTRRIDSHSQHTPCPPPIEAIPLIQQQPAIRIEYLPVRMTHSEEEKGDGQEATHTQHHSSGHSKRESQHRRRKRSRGDTGTRNNTPPRPQRQRNRRRPHSTRPIHTRSVSQPASQPIRDNGDTRPCIHSYNLNCQRRGEDPRVSCRG